MKYVLFVMLFSLPCLATKYDKRFPVMKNAEKSKQEEQVRRDPTDSERPVLEKPRAKSKTQEVDHSEDGQLDRR